MRKTLNRVFIMKKKSILFIVLGIFVFLSYPFFKLDFILCKQLLYLYLFFVFGVLGYDSHQKKSNIQYFYYVFDAHFNLILSVTLDTLESPKRIIQTNKDSPVLGESSLITLTSSLIHP